MDKLHELHEEAVQDTKRKIKEDIFRFMETKETAPSFNDYLSERIHYIEQLWVNVWLNKVTNFVSRSEKKAFLRDRDYEVEGVDKKIINQVFRNEMRGYQPFDVIPWLQGLSESKAEQWEERYKLAREGYLLRLEQDKIEVEQKSVKFEITKALESTFHSVKQDWYLPVRYAVAQKLASDFKEKVRYRHVDTFMLEEQLEEIGPFYPDEFGTLSEFFHELNGLIHRTMHRGRSYWEYETYFYVYEEFVSNYVLKTFPKLLLKRVSEEHLTKYQKAFEDELTSDELRKWLQHEFLDAALVYTDYLQEEYVEDLLNLAQIPFEEEAHKAIYHEDVSRREERKAAELAELERKRQEEDRMMNDIFGREYSVSLGGNTRYVLHIGETNTGKTHQALESMREAGSGIYLAPLRLLALEVYDRLNNEGVPCNLKTGEEEKTVPGANHVACTVEMFYEKEEFDVVVIDEAQMMADKDRGFSWYKAITKARAREVHIIGSRNVKPMLLGLLENCDVEINEYNRDIPLQVEEREFSLKHAKRGDALVCFSRRRVLETASKLQNNGHSVSMIYGSMPPETRKKQMQRFIKGETRVIVATDAIGMGLNLPIRRIVFLENDKFDGTRRRILTSQEVKQIAGRAGRKGIYDVGKVAFTKDIKKMSKLLDQEDEPVQSFAIAPTNSIFERFQKYYHDLGRFFELWEKFESPFGTQKASLSEERELYELVRGTEIEGRLSMMDLYGFLHLPFSKKEPELTSQWLETMDAIISGTELPEPKLKRKNLEQQEVAYKAVGLHLLFLYRLGRGTEAIYWERLREDIADGVHESLNTEVSSMTLKCKQCGKRLPAGFRFPICDSCHYARVRKRGRGNRG
ncbi:DEAD/DEAH box helicase [Bacillus sp. SG-1]|uniref:DEAD/DEAH box helicase n=1 Tax=Bacillus sp. SG-1 TaxID=161544 RepID=UPI0001543275|nr:DEAD/DEAH box helicase [Bacillus sp. SG-1]EDL65507.1 probable ATP-dependent RNA helicase [Bacillus sp. SG-1]